MKRWMAAILVILMLCGCSGGEELDPALALRAAMQNSGCSFDAVITADYGNMTYTFNLGCQADKEGNLQFSVKEPESISGIKGSISAGIGKLTFDDIALSFELLADGQMTPVSAPWIMTKALLSGYILSGGSDGEYHRVTIRETYEEDAMTVDIWLDAENKPVQAEILWKERRIVTIRVENFMIL